MTDLLSKLLLDVPPELKPFTERLEALDNLDQQRQRSVKRIASGVIWGDKLTGFYVGDKPLGMLKQQDLSVLEESDQMPPSLIRATQAVKGDPVSRPWGLSLTGMARPQWGEVYREVHDKFRRLMASPDGLGCLKDIYEALGCATDCEPVNKAIQPPSVGPFLKQTEEFAEQVHYYERMRGHDPRLASFLVPMAALRLRGNRCLCIMPFLQGFVTLHQLLCWAAGAPLAGAFAAAKEELPQVLEQTAVCLGTFLELSRGLTPALSPLAIIRGKVKRLLENQMPVLLGRQLFREADDLARQTLEDKAAELLTGPDPDDATYGHGDLNATNIMIGAKRLGPNRLEICVRLIDPNPTGCLGDKALEIGRLAHWMEVALPLTHSAGTGFSIHFPIHPAERHFLNRSPRLELSADIIAGLQEHYEHFLAYLRREIPCLQKDSGRQKLALAVALGHLVGISYWDSSIARTTSFLAAVDELSRLRGGAGPAVVEAGRGLWDVRRRQGASRRAREMLVT